MQTVIDVVDREGIAHPAARIVYHVEPGDPTLRGHPAALPYAVVCDVIDTATGRSILLALHAADVERLEQLCLALHDEQHPPSAAA